jgi:hypothetical protein
VQDGHLVMAAKSLVEQAIPLPPRHQVRWNQRRTTHSTCEVKNPTNADIAIIA